MILIAEMKFTDARKQLTNVIDRVQGFMPVVIQPRKASEEHTFLFKHILVHELVAAYKFKLELTDKEEGAYAYWLSPLDIYGYGETQEEALDSLVDDVMFYVQQYLENPTRYFNSPNRRAHLPFVMKVTLCKSAEDVKRMFLEDAAEVQKS